MEHDGGYLLGLNSVTGGGYKQIYAKTLTFHLQALMNRHCQFIFNLLRNSAFMSFPENADFQNYYTVAKLPGCSLLD